MNVEQTRKQAQDKNTSSEILAQLAKSKDNLTRRYIADNPNTPEKILDYLSNDKDLLVRGNVAENPSTSDSILRKIANSPTENKFVVEIANVALDRRQAQNKNTSPERLAELAKSEDRVTQKYVSANPNTREKILDYLSNDRDLFIRDNVAKNPSTSNSTLRKIANSSTEHLSTIDVAKNVLKRRQIQRKETQARNENTSPEILAQLAKNEDWEHERIRKYVASNSNTPLNILEKLAREFPAEIMANPILELLILENSSQLLTLKREVAKSPNTPLNILDRLKEDSDHNVRLNIFVNPNTPDKILDSLVKEGRAKFGLRPAKKTDTPARVLDYLKKHPSSTVRRRVARNPSTPAKTLDYLSNDENMSVREAVAKNFSTPNDILEKIANSPTESSYVSAIASRVLEHRQAEDINTPSAILAQLAVNNWGKPVSIAVAQNPNTSIETLQELSNHTDEEIARLAKYNLEQKQKAMQQAQNENTPPQILARLANHKSKLVRQYVANNPNTALEVLEKLSNEFPEYVIANSVFDLLILENSSKQHQDFFIHAIMLARSSETPRKTFLETMDSTLLIDIGYFT